MTWTQIYDPCGNPWLSTLLAAVPIVLLLGLLGSGRVAAPWAALAGLAAAFVLAVFAYVPAVEHAGYGERVFAWLPAMTSATLYGAAYGLFPIGWIVVAAIFLYNLTVETGQFAIVKHSVAALSDDQRIQALLIAFCFGAFVEGAAGFGTPVAISSALLMGAGFRPLDAAGLALIANTAPVAFGALGTPILMLQKVTDLDLMQLSQMAGRQLPFFSLLIPAWLVWAMAGWRGMVGVWPALLVCGGSFALFQWLIANYHGPWLVDIGAGLISLISLAVFLRVWQPRTIWRFADAPVATPLTPNPSPSEAGGEGNKAGTEQPQYTVRQLVTAWMPWILLTVMVFLWGLPPIKERLSAATTVKVAIPGLHREIARDQPVVRERKIEEAEFQFNWLTATGTSIFLAAIASAAWLRVGPRRFVRLGWLTLHQLRWPLFTIACMLAIAHVTRYSGMDATLGLAFTKTGWTYPFFAAILGWLGVALTGSDTSSNALFGSLQTITAGQLGLSPVLIATANSTGGVMGKMIDAQSIVVAAAATQQPGREGPILRYVFWHSLALAALMGLLVLVQAYWATWMVP